MGREAREKSLALVGQVLAKNAKWFRVSFNVVQAAIGKNA